MDQIAEILQGWEWNEALPDGLGTFNDSLVSLVASGPDGSPKQIGTAFIVAAYGGHAVAFTAAHNFFEGVHKVQTPQARHHATALAEFLPEAELVKLDRESIRAIYKAGSRVEACVLGFAVWDKRSDLAVLTIGSQNLADKTLFNSILGLGRVVPSVGDLVCVVGYGDMQTMDEHRNGDQHQFKLARRVVMRAGKVKAIHKEGHILCRGACLETTIPVFGGMSGGPAFLVPARPGDPILPFGWVSSDPDETVEQKNDRSRVGCSIVGLLPIEVANDIDSRREVMLKLAISDIATNKEFAAEGEASSVHFLPHDETNGR